MIDEFIEAVINSKYEDIPQNVVSKLKLSIADTFGVMIRGTVEPSFYNAYLQIRDQFSNSGNSTNFVEGEKIGSLGASFINSMASHILLSDDEHNPTVLHPGAGIIPSIFALGEERDISGKDFVLSALISYETSIRLAEYLGPKHYTLGFSPTGTVNSIGILMGISKMLGLRHDEIKTAVSIAAQEMGGIRDYQRDASINYAMFLTAWASFNGVVSALLAKSGLRPLTLPISKESYFVKAFGGDVKNDFINDFSKKWRIMEINFKPYPSSRFCNGPVTYILNLVNKEKLSSQIISSMEVGVNKVHYMATNFPDVDSRGKAISSLQYNLAAAVYFGKLGFFAFDEKSLRDDNIKSLMKRIKIYNSNDSDNYYPAKWVTHMNVTTTDGRVYNDSFDALTFEEISEGLVKEKFYENMSVRSDKDVIENIWQALMNIEDAKSLSEVSDAFRPLLFKH